MRTLGFVLLLLMLVAALLWLGLHWFVFWVTRD